MARIITLHIACNFDINGCSISEDGSAYAYQSQMGDHVFAFCNILRPDCASKRAPSPQRGSQVCVCQRISLSTAPPALRSRVPLAAPIQTLRKKGRTRFLAAPLRFDLGSLLGRDRKTRTGQLEPARRNRRDQQVGQITSSCQRLANLGGKLMFLELAVRFQCRFP